MSYPLKKECSIIGIYDNDAKKWGTKLCGYDVYSPEELKQQNYDQVIIASTIYSVVEDITSQLEAMNIPRNKYVYATCIFTIDYFKGDLDEYFDVPKKDIIPFKKGSAEIYQNYIGETHKSHERRVREGFFEKYCNGEGLDIGYGADIIVPGCSGWDLRNGDAQYLTGIEDESFDFVYSSHCLEHMVDVRTSLKNWYRVVKKGGYLIRHMSVSFGDEPFQNFSRKTFVKKFERVLKCFDGIQAVYALHENTDIKHIHIVFNTVSIYGNRLNLNKKALNKFVNQLEQTFGKCYSDAAKVPVVLYC